MGLGPVDRTFGVVFGIVRAVLLLGLLYLPFHLLMDDEAKETHFAESKTHLYIEKTANLIAGFLPSSEDVQEKADEVTNGEIKQKLMDHNILDDGDGSSTILEQLTGEKTQDDEDRTKDAETGTGYETKQRQELKNLLSEPTFNE